MLLLEYINYRYSIYECGFCGHVGKHRSDNIKAGRTKSCGCQNIGKNAIIHGHASNSTHSLTYNSWCGMKQRCNNPASAGYKYYGGRGVKVCKEWASFENFLAAMGERPSRKHCLCRNNDIGDYAPGNVSWGLKLDNIRDMLDRKYERVG